MRTFVLVLLLLSAPLTAHAGGDVGVVVTGEATMQPQLAAQLEGWLAKHGHTVVAAPLPPDGINTMVDCFVIEDEGCARTVVEKRSKVRSLVYARIEVAPGNTALDRDVALTIYWFDKGHSFVAKRKKCPKCTENALHEAADEMMTVLATEGQKVGHLKCTSDPIGADVAVDGKRVGTTPLDHPLAPGTYKIVVSHQRRGEETREVVVKAGEIARLDVSLRLSDGDTGGEKRPGSRTLPLVVIGAGAALAATGLVMLAIDQDPGPHSPDPIRNTGPAGTGFALVGAAAITGGVIWYLSSRKSSAPIAAVSHEGAYIGWFHTF
jgi:PEGA domain-containing protein